MPLTQVIRTAQIVQIRTAPPTNIIRGRSVQAVTEYRTAGADRGGVAGILRYCRQQGSWCDAAEVVARPARRQDDGTEFRGDQ
jgi:hypothetical protein